MEKKRGEKHRVGSARRGVGVKEMRRKNSYDRIGSGQQTKGGNETLPDRVGSEWLAKRWKRRRLHRVHSEPIRQPTPEPIPFCQLGMDVHFKSKHGFVTPIRSEPNTYIRTELISLTGRECVLIENATPLPIQSPRIFPNRTAIIQLNIQEFAQLT